MLWSRVVETLMCSSSWCWGVGQCVVEMQFDLCSFWSCHSGHQCTLASVEQSVTYKSDWDLSVLFAFLQTAFNCNICSLRILTVFSAVSTSGYSLCKRCRKLVAYMLKLLNMGLNPINPKTVQCLPYWLKSWQSCIVVVLFCCCLYSRSRGFMSCKHTAHLAKCSTGSG